MKGFWCDISNINFSPFTFKRVIVKKPLIFINHFLSMVCVCERERDLCNFNLRKWYM